MSKPLDDLATAEQSAARNASSAALGDAGRAGLEIVVALAVGIAGALGLAWFLTVRLVAAVTLVAQGLGRLAAGDLTWSSGPVRGRDELSAMAGLTVQAADGVRGIVTRVRATVVAMTEAVGVLDAASEGLAANAAVAVTEIEAAAGGIAMVSQNVQSVSVGSGQMVAAINEIAGNAQEAAQVAQTGVQAALSTDSRVRQLDRSSSEIMDIVKVITTIAEQTNLLALNATIEAARAGESGKGFAVVAGEVKELASETALATEQITSRVQTIQSDTHSVVASIGGIRKVIEQINEMQTCVAAAVEEQSATTAEINRTVGEAAATADRVAAGVRCVATTNEQTVTHVQVTRESARQLTRLAGALSEEIRAFIL